MAKGIRSIWIDSDTPESLGNKVIKDGVEIATVPNGVQEYKDPDVVVNREYKYVIQSYTATGQSTDEILGTNLNYYTIVDATGLKPIMTNFRVEEANKDRLYFDAPLGSVDGTDETKYIIFGKEISGLNTTDNYFTVTEDFDSWDNNTIRQEVGNGIVYDFTLEPITNYIPKPIPLVIKYVTVAGGGDGSSVGNPMTLPEAFLDVAPGNLYYVKNGNYGNIGHLITVDGTRTNPIQFIGYNDTDGIGVNPDFGWSYPDNTGLDSTKGPVISGDQSKIFVEGQTKNGWIFHNFQVERMIAGWKGLYNGLMQYENCIGEYMGSDVDPSQDGAFISTSATVGALSTPATNVRIKDCIGYNASANIFFLCAHNSKAIGCTAISDWLDNNSLAADYYFGVRGTNITYEDCHANRAVTQYHIGHGFDIKSENIPTEYNLIYNCDVLNVYQAFVLRHEHVQYNVFKNIKASQNGYTNISGGVIVRDGASNNIIENFEISGATQGAIRFVESDERGVWLTAGDNNTFVNGLIYNCKNPIEASGYAASEFNNNEFINCTFDSSSNFFSISTLTGTGNKLINCTITYASTFGTTGIFTFENCNWFNNGFAPPTGVNNTEVEPSFIDGYYKTWVADISETGNPIYTYPYDYNINANSGLRNTGEVVTYPKYDKNNTERGAEYSIGAYEYE